jgi:hypothetical protein
VIAWRELRNRWFAASALEGDGFEPSVSGDTPWVPSWKMSIILQSLPAGYPRVRRCGDVYVPAFVKGSMAWLLCLPVGQALPLASSYRSTLFFFRRGIKGSNPFPSCGESGANFSQSFFPAIGSSPHWPGGGAEQLLAEQQRDKPQPTQPTWAVGSMGWLAEQNKSS